jgi:hypothetical protein
MVAITTSATPWGVEARVVAVQVEANEPVDQAVILETVNGCDPTASPCTAQGTEYLVAYGLPLDA